MAYDFLKALQDIYQYKKGYTDEQYNIEHNADGSQRYATYDPEKYMATKQNNMPTIEGAKVNAPYTSDAYTTDERARLKQYEDLANKKYDELYNNGYEQVAEKMKGMSLGDAYNYMQGAVNKTQGKTLARDYIVNQLANKYGMDRDTANGYVTYNDNTGDVLLGGKAIDATGRSEFGNRVYYDGTDVLDNAINDFVNTNGITPGREAMYSNELQRQLGNNAEWDKLVTQNPYTSDVGKTIMRDYGLYGDNMAESAAASRAASNGGNIDSFAAQTATNARNGALAQGHQSVQGWYKAQIDAANGRQSANDATLNGIPTADAVFRDSAIKEREASMKEKLTDQQIKESNDNMVTNRSNRMGTQQLVDLQANNPYMQFNGNTGQYEAKETAFEGGYQGMYNQAQNTYNSDLEAYNNAESAEDKQALANKLYQDAMDINNIAIARNAKTGTNDLPVMSLPNAEVFIQQMTNGTDMSIATAQNKFGLDKIDAETAAKMAIDDNATQNNMSEAGYKASISGSNSGGSGGSGTKGNGSNTKNDGGSGLPTNVTKDAQKNFASRVKKTWKDKTGQDLDIINKKVDGSYYVSVNGASDVIIEAAFAQNSYDPIALLKSVGITDKQIENYKTTHK